MHKCIPKERKKEEENGTCALWRRSKNKPWIWEEHMIAITIGTILLITSHILYWTIKEKTFRLGKVAGLTRIHKRSIYCNLGNKSTTNENTSI